MSTLTGLEGWRVEVVTQDGETRRFIVGRSGSGHVELKNRASTSGRRATTYVIVTLLEDVQSDLYAEALEVGRGQQSVRHHGESS